jgi:hypothetical protein
VSEQAVADANKAAAETGGAVDTPRDERATAEVAPPAEPGTSNGDAPSVVSETAQRAMTTESATGRPPPVGARASAGDPVRPRGSWPATLAGLTVILPGLAALGAVSLFLLEDTWSTFLNSTGSRAFLWGSLLGVGAWLLLALPLRSMSTARGACRSAWGELDQHREALRSRYDRIRSAGGLAGPLSEAEQAIGRIDARLDGGVGSSDWIWATGYISTWQDIHRGDQALVEAASTDADTVVAHAMHDYLRMQGSTIPRDRELLQVLLDATDAIAPGALAPLGVRPPAGGSASPISKSAAPLMLREVRRTINEFRDEARCGLVRARDQLAVTVGATGVLTWLLIGLALTAGASRDEVIAGSAFYLVAGLVGLFRQLQLASARETVSGEDFNLAAVRLIHAPLFSGIAGVAGVVVTRLGTSGDATALSSIFNIGANRLGLLVAAVFGLTPNLLTANLHSKAEAYKSDLKSSDAAQGRSTS